MMASSNATAAEQRAGDWLDSLADLLRRNERGLQAARLGLLEWGRRYLPNYFRLPPSRMHIWLAEQLDQMHERRGAKVNVIGPRGAAKSTLVTLAYALRAALEGWEPYLWIISDTRHQACGHLENIKQELTENRLLAGEFSGIGKGPVWRASTIQLTNGATIEAFGTLQRIRGRRRRAHRPTLIICDDVQNDQHMESALQREHSRRWFEGTLLKAGTKRTNIISLATALHRDALALRLHRTPGWTSRIFPAILRWPDNMPLWQQWEALYCDVDDPRNVQGADEFFAQNRSQLEAGAELLWPEEEDLYTLMRMRVEGGRAAFEREKQGSPANPDLCEWPEEYFQPHIWFDEWPDSARAKTVALDPSKGQDSQRGDYSAFVLLWVDLENVLYVDADLARRPTPRIVADGVEILRRFRPDAFAIESNQFQELLGREFEVEFQRQNFIGIQPWTLENRVNKRVRIRRLGPLLSTHRLRFLRNSPGARLLVEQLRQFPSGDHDDGPDALEMAIRLAGEILGEPSGDGLGDRLPIEGS